MCGIAGAWKTTPISREQIERCMPVMCHRGPDHQEYRTFRSHRGRSTTLLHSRLSIIDIDPRSNQPMGSGGFWLAFNGEIYNYREVRAFLEGKGIRFKTASDTEVLLEGIREMGWDILDMLEGMWAFALYDANTGRLSLCRDRFGEKPLSFLKTGDGIVFGSEISFISSLSGLKLKPNMDHLARFLINGYKSMHKTIETFFDGVEDVPPRSIIHFDDDGSVSRYVYWNPVVEIDPSMDFAGAVVGTRERLNRSVELRMRADVPLAFSLSGGVDSVALVSIANRELGADVHGFTIMNSDPRYEERALVELVVSELGIQHTSIELDTHNFLPQFKEMIRHRSAPILTITYYVQWLLMQEVARAGFKVIVGGTGADEIFTGYYDHHLFYIEALEKAERQAAVDNWTRQLKPFVRNPFLQDPNRFISEPTFRDHIYLDSNRFSGYLKRPFWEPFQEVNYHSVPLRNRMLNELFHESVPVIMHEEDMNAMSFSIENRSPYLDRNLMEFTSQIPSSLLVQNGFAKAVLRESVRGVAPDAILDNPRKVGFNAPISDLINLDDPAVRSEVLEDSPIFDLVQRSSVEGLLDRRELRNSESKFLFSFLGTKIFLDEFS